MPRKLNEAAVEETPATETVSALEFSALFAADLPSEIVEVPGAAGSWVKLQAMDADAFATYLQSGQKINLLNGKMDVNVEIDQAKQELMLLTSTITDFCFVRYMRSPQDPEAKVPTEVKPLNVKGAHRISFMEAQFKALAREFRAWLVNECQRVNGLTVQDEKNSE